MASGKIKYWPWNLGSVNLVIPVIWKKTQTQTNVKRDKSFNFHKISFYTIVTFSRHSHYCSFPTSHVKEQSPVIFDITVCHIQFTVNNFLGSKDSVLYWLISIFWNPLVSNFALTLNESWTMNRNICLTWQFKLYNLWRAGWNLNDGFLSTVRSNTNQNYILSHA